MIKFRKYLCVFSITFPFFLFFYLITLCERECWRAFDNSAQFSLIYLFDFRFERMFNKDAPESLKWLTYLVVNNRYKIWTLNNADTTVPF